MRILEGAAGSRRDYLPFGEEVAAGVGAKGAGRGCRPPGGARSNQGFPAPFVPEGGEPRMLASVWP
jgi:hypothetical protein